MIKCAELRFADGRGRNDWMDLYLIYIPFIKSNKKLLHQRYQKYLIKPNYMTIIPIVSNKTIALRGLAATS